MNCKKCGFELVLENGVYVCRLCGAKYALKTDSDKSNFVMSGGILTAYVGNKSEIRIPEGVVAIGPSAFKDRVGIQKVIFASTVTTIENNAFENCINLVSIENYQNVTVFKDECFRNSGLTEVTIYPNVKHLGRYCFACMPNLETVTYNPILDLKLVRTFSKCPKLTNVIMDRPRFFPSFKPSESVLNNKENTRPTLGDAFSNTPYITATYNSYMEKYKQGICPECGGKLSKGLFHARCNVCKVDWKN